MPLFCACFPFSDVPDHLGEKIDLISCPYQTTCWGDRCNSFHLWDLPLCVTCAKTHPLARRERLTLSDLHGETLICTNPGIKPPLEVLQFIMAVGQVGAD